MIPNNPVPFLTLEDPNAKIRGSRDPLGVQPLWVAFGRHVVTNLTTQSTSVRGFTIVLLGRYFAADLIDRSMATREDALDVFLRMEQVGAYVRHAAHGDEVGIRGIERVKKFLDEYRGRVPIQADRRGMILADQKVYGLWGLYSVAARRSGLIPDGPLGVQENARQLVEQCYLPHLNGTTGPLRRILANGGTLDTRHHTPVFQALARILKPGFDAAELDLYRRALRDGLDVEDAPAERQARLRELLESHADLDEPVGREEVLRLARAAGPTDEALADHLLRIAALEALLAPVDALFQHLLMQHGRKVEQVAKEIRDRWGAKVPHLDKHTFLALVPEIKQTVGPEVTAAVTRCHAALTGGDFVEATSALLDWNTLVMHSRGGGPWLAVAGGRLDVRYRGGDQTLPNRDELPALWRNPYFIDSIKSVTRQLRG